MAIESSLLVHPEMLHQSPSPAAQVVLEEFNKTPGDSRRATVSVLVPSYNHAPFIARCLRSIIRQTHTPLELIVIDDGSTDGSLAEIQSVLNDCPFDCELLARTHRGLSHTLNEGLRLSRGEYFAYLGSDDMWLQDFLKARVDLLQMRTQAVLAYGHVFVVNEDDQILERSDTWANYIDGPVRQMLLHHLVPFSPSVVYRREPLARHYWNEEAGLEDYDLYLRLSGDGEFAFDGEVLCAWRSHRYNKSRNLDFMLSECLKAQTRLVGGLNISKPELEQAHSELKWRYALDFLKAGQKLKALELICLNLKGAPSYRSVARMMIGLIVPKPTLDWRRRLVQKRTMKQYGAVRI